MFTMTGGVIFMEKINIILGPPGTGKTENLLRIVDRELKNKTADSNEIGFFSFTTKATNEARDRAKAKFSLTNDDLPYFCTLHAFGKRQLGMAKTEIMNPKDYISFSAESGVDLEFVTQDWEDTGIITTDNKLLREITKCRNQCMELEEFYNKHNFNFNWYELLRAYRALEDYKHNNNKHDFTDMLSLWIETGPTPKLEVVFVDEAQDLTNLQWEMCSKIWKNAKRVYISGDDDQAIFRWAGADIEHFINMEGNVTILKQSYRCPSAVHRIADSIVKRIDNRRNKEWLPRRARGIAEMHAYPDPIDLSIGKWLILAPCGYMLNEIEENLRQQGLAYKKNNKLSVKKEILSAVDAWKKLNEGEEISYDEVSYIYSYLPTKTGVERGYKNLKTLSEDKMYGVEELTMHHGLCSSGTPWNIVFEKIGNRNIEYIQSLEKVNKTLSFDPLINLSTIHMAKGGECDNVMLFTDLSRANREEMEINPDDTNRVFYVGVTRAKEQLHIIEPQNYGGFKI